MKKRLDGPMSDHIVLQTQEYMERLMKMAMINYNPGTLTLGQRLLEINRMLLSAVSDVKTVVVNMPTWDRHYNWSEILDSQHELFGKDMAWFDECVPGRGPLPRTYYFFRLGLKVFDLTITTRLGEFSSGTGQDYEISGTPSEVDRILEAHKEMCDKFNLTTTTYKHL